MTDTPDTLPFSEYGPMMSSPTPHGPYRPARAGSWQQPAGPQREQTTAPSLRPVIPYRPTGAPPRIAPATRAAVLYDYIGNHRPVDIARKHGICPTTVYDFAARACLPRRTKRRSAKAEQHICTEKRDAIMADHRAGDKQAAIARRHNVSPQFVSKLVKKGRAVADTQSASR